VVSNLLIVESKNDELFVRALVNHLNLTNVQVDRPICNIDDYQCLEGVDLKKLTLRLKALKSSLPKKDIQAVGIILDHDGKKDERIKLINDALKHVFDSKQQIKDTNQFIDISAKLGIYTYDFSISCFLVNIDSKGELETLLKAIKAKPSVYADCLIEWRKCIESHDKKILSDKEFDKFWVNNYIRFDTCSSNEKKQAFRKCSMHNFDYILENKKDIFNFDHPVLGSFKSYLSLFQNFTN
jgi:hypothetical protein